jgi:hypothetical protein
MMIDGKNFLDLLKGLPSRMEIWERFLTTQRTRKMAEIGVWKGDFAEHALKKCAEIECYYMVDPWANLPDWNKPFNVKAETFDEIYREMDQKTAFAASRRTILRGRTKEVIDQIPDASLDFAYIDGDHTLRGITIDLITLWPKIKDGGFVGGDDFTPTPWQHDIRFEPTLVCPFSIYFAEAMNMPIVALDHNQFLIKKDRGAGFSFRDTTGAYGDISLNKLPPAMSA